MQSKRCGSARYACSAVLLELKQLAHAFSIRSLNRRSGAPVIGGSANSPSFSLCHFYRVNFKTDLKAAANRAENGRQVIHARIALGRQHTLQALAGLICQFGQLLESERRIHEVTKNETCRLRFVTQKQCCSLIEKCFCELRIALDAFNHCLLEIASECHIDHLFRFPALSCFATSALMLRVGLAAATADASQVKLHPIARKSDVGLGQADGIDHIL